MFLSFLTRVAANESLFEDYDPSNAEWPSERYLCVCKKNVIKMRIDGRGTPDCSSSVVSNCSRRREKVVAVGGGCEVKRSSSKFLYDDLVDRRVKRSETRDRKIKMEVRWEIVCIFLLCFIMEKLFWFLIGGYLF